MSTHRRLCLGMVGLLSLLVVLVIPTGANATGGSGPRLQVSMRSFPTDLVEGSTPSPAEASAREGLPGYAIVVRNVGGGGVTGPVTVTVTLPPGITVDPSLPPELAQLLPGNSGIETFTECETPSPETVVCTVAESALPSGTEVPGAIARVAIAVNVGMSVTQPAIAHVDVSGGGAPPVSSSLTTTVGNQEATFDFLSGVHGLTGSATEESGLDADLAGSHPFSVLLEGNFTSREVSPAGSTPFAWPVQAPQDITFELPKGLAVNPQAPTKLCTEAELISASQDIGKELGCPPASQVGAITVTSVVAGVAPLVEPLYDMQPPPGAPAELAFNAIGVVVNIQGGLDGKFHLSASGNSILSRYAVLGIQAYLWGNPADPRHNPERRGKGECAKGCGLGPNEANKAPFITMPTSCGEPLSLNATATSWEGGTANEDSTFLDAGGNPLEMEGCNALAFEPSIESKATTDKGDSPSGLEFSIHQPQDESLEGRSSAALKDVTVSLPEGMVVDPSVANGLASCSEDEMGYQPEEGKIGFKTTPQSCPDAAKIGTIEVHTPLLEKALPGSIYVAKPYDNPFGSLLAIYLAVEDEETGVVAKLAGRVTPDPVTGRLTATFMENPELPLEDIGLRFFNGAQGALSTPLTCGQHTTTSTLTPWSSPEGADAHPSDSFQVTSGCYGSEAQAPKTVAFSAGTVTPVAGVFSPFVLGVSRPNGSQHLTGVETTLPEGLLGSVAGVAYCPESGVAQAVSREEPEKGRLEQQDPSCPSASELGSVRATVGSGGSPTPVSGHAYLAGPYRDAPLSVVVIVPAVAGPFDLGTVVVRVALSINEQTAQIHALADPLPTIRDGIPLDIRSIELDLNRSGFMFNPTSCDAQTIEGQLATQPGQTIPLSNRFQVGSCQNLPFKPVMSISTQGKTSKASGASLDVKVSQKPGEAHIHKVDLTLPTVLPARLTTLQQACTEAQFNTNPAGCPPGSFIGIAKALTPILNVPLTGPAVLVSHGGAAFPDVEFLLQANERGSDIRIDLDGRTDIKKGVTYSRFETVPDAPISSFETSLPQGPHSVLAATGNLCASKPTIPTEMVGQNGAVIKQSTKVTVTGCPKSKTLTRAQKLKLALKACHKKHNKTKRQACERQARKKYGPLKKAKKAKKK